MLDVIGIMKAQPKAKKRSEKRKGDAPTKENEQAFFYEEKYLNKNKQYIYWF